MDSKAQRALDSMGWSQVAAKDGEQVTSFADMNFEGEPVEGGDVDDFQFCGMEVLEGAEVVRKDGGFTLRRAKAKEPEANTPAVKAPEETVPPPASGKSAGGKASKKKKRKRSKATKETAGGAKAGPSSTTVSTALAASSSAGPDDAGGDMVHAEKKGRRGKKEEEQVSQTQTQHQVPQPQALEIAAPQGTQEGTTSRERRTARKKAKRDAENGIVASAAEPGPSAQAASGGDGGSSLSDWDLMGLHPKILENLSRKGFTTPTPIQAACIPLALRDRKDVLAAAEVRSDVLAWCACGGP